MEYSSKSEGEEEVEECNYVDRRYLECSIGPMFEACSNIRLLKVVLEE